MKTGKPTEKKPIRDHRDLRVWRKSHLVENRCRDLAADFSEQHAEMGRNLSNLSAGISAKIEEGQTAPRPSIYIEYLEDALAQVPELENTIVRAHAEGCLEAPVGDSLLEYTAEIARMLRRLIASLHAARSGRR